MIWLILTILVAFLLWYHLVRPLNHFQKLGIPTGNPVPFFGDQFKTATRQMSFYDWLKMIYDRHPGKRYCGFYQLTMPTLMIRDPELIKQITIKDFEHFTDHRPFIDPDADPIWGGNLFSLKGQKWRDMRTTLAGSYTSSKMKNMFQVINGAAVDFVQFFVDKKEDYMEVEMKDTFTRYTNDVIATTAFGIELNSLKEPNNEFYIMGKRTTNFNGLITRLKFFGYFMFPSLYKTFKISLIDRNVTNYFHSIIYKTVKTREEQGIVRPDMLNQLMEARQEKRPLTDVDITSQALIFFFAGFDTISTVLCFTAYELVANGHVQDKLRKEIVDTWRSNNGSITYDVLLEMKYLDLVILESLRKWPPASGVDRVVTKPYIIQPTRPDEQPVVLKTGDYLFLPLLGIHRDPDHFPDPEKFDPERFNEQNKANIKPYTYLPFGSGPRSCIGNRFALLEIKALLFHFLLNFQIDPSDKTQIPLKLDASSFTPLLEGGFWFGMRKINLE